MFDKYYESDSTIYGAITIMPLFLIPAVLFCSNEKDSQGENMFMRCVSELVIESREVSDPH